MVLDPIPLAAPGPLAAPDAAGSGLERLGRPGAGRPVAPDGGQLIGEVRVGVAAPPHGVDRGGKRERAAGPAENLDAVHHGRASVGVDLQVDVGYFGPLARV